MSLHDRRQDRSSQCDDLVQILFCFSRRPPPSRRRPPLSLTPHTLVFTVARLGPPESCIFSPMLLYSSRLPSFPFPPRPWPRPLTSGGPDLYTSLYPLASLLALPNPAEGSSSTGMHCPAGPLPPIAAQGPALGVGALGIREEHFFSSGDVLNLLPIAFGKI